MVRLPVLVTILRTALSNRRWDVVYRLAVPPCAVLVTLTWIAAAASANSSHWAPTPWDVTGDWTAPGRGHGARRAELGLVRPTLRGVRLSSPKWRIVQQHEFFLLGPEFPRIFSRECGCYSGITHGARLRDHIGYR